MLYRGFEGETRVKSGKALILKTNPRVRGLLNPRFRLVWVEVGLDFEAGRCMQSVRTGLYACEFSRL